MRLLIALTGLSLFALSVSSEAGASMVLFQITGPHTASFTVEQSPTPNLVAPGSLFRVLIQDVSIDGSNPTQGTGAFTSNVLQIDDSVNVIQGIDLQNFWTGSYSNPTFVIGNYGSISGRYFFPTGISTLGTYSLTISAVDAAVPEPATWALMLLGFGSIGFAMRRSRRKTALTQVA